MRQIRIAVGALVSCAMALVGTNVLLACTAFCAVGAGQVLVGNNEDWNNPRTKIRFVPARPGAIGRMYVGFDDMWPRGGMNERGLWFDGFSAPPLKPPGPSDLPHFQGNLVDKAMAECGTVEEVVRLFSQYNRGFLTAAIFMFADASGDAVSIERDAIVRKTGKHFVQTNFHQSRPRTGLLDERFEIASKMLERAGDDISLDQTGITGTFDLEFEWSEDRVASLTAAIHDRYGLRLSPAKRDLEALIVDRVQRDAALVLLAQIGRITSGAPAPLRQQIAEILTIR